MNTHQCMVATVRFLHRLVHTCLAEAVCMHSMRMSQEVLSKRLKLIVVASRNVRYFFLPYGVHMSTSHMREAACRSPQSPPCKKRTDFGDRTGPGMLWVV